ncbi:hypothetical protein OG474_22030 [Kribbella sp. NBC_01505]|uniref:hypothetical protein n=1 Tax=Kribbella sp. NBC_01505 TaxID=2903580 RepID=UPI0038694D0A
MAAATPRGPASIRLERWERELAVLRGMVDAARGGVGKSSLLEALTAEAEGRRVTQATAHRAPVTFPGANTPAAA